MSSPLSAFTAVPNPQMLAFMGTQSFIMMYQAGEGWQYGKRKQSAMSNEEFNKQTPLSIMDRQRTELINALPSIKDSMNAMTPLISTIVEQYGDFINAAIKATPATVQKAAEGIQFPFFADASSGATTQKQFQQDNPNTINGLIKAFTILAEGIAKGGFGRAIINTDKTPDAGIEEFGPSPPPSGGILGNLDIHKAQVETAKAAEFSHQPPPATVSQLRRQQITESGLSPLAYESREKFKVNIKTTASNIEIVQEQLAKRMSFPRTPGRDADENTLKTHLASLVKKLSALRIKYREVYGVYY